MLMTIDAYDGNNDEYGNNSYVSLQTGDWDCATFLAELNIWTSKPLFKLAELNQTICQVVQKWTLPKI